MIGIHLGNDHCTVAYIGAEGPALISDAVGNAYIPHAIYCHNAHKTVTGHQALAFLKTDAKRCMNHFMQMLGSDTKYDCADRQWTPTECLSLMFEHMYTLAEEQIGHAIEKVVIAVPAYFHDGQRTAVMQAALQHKHIHRVQLINQPSAAAFRLLLDKNITHSTVSVIELGHKHMDVSIADIHESGCELLSSNGISPLHYQEQEVEQNIRAISKSIKQAYADCKLATNSDHHVLIIGSEEHIKTYMPLLQETCAWQNCSHFKESQHAIATGAAIFATIHNWPTEKQEIVDYNNNQQASAGCASIVLGVISLLSCAWLITFCIP